MNDYDNEIMELDSEVRIFVNDMISSAKKEAQRKADVENAFKKIYVVGNYNKSIKEDFYAISDEEVILTPGLPIPTPIEHVTKKDNRKRLDNLVSMLYKGLQILKNEECVVNFSDGYKGLRYKCLPMVKHLSMILGYKPPHYDEVIEGELFKILDFAESDIIGKTNIVADMFFEKMKVDKYFSDSIDKHNKRIEAVEKVGKGDFVELAEHDFPTGLGWRKENGKLFRFDIDDEDEDEDQLEEEEIEDSEEEEEEDEEVKKKELTNDFDRKVKELDAKYKVKF